MRFTALVFLAASLAGCVQFPEIDDATNQVARDAEYPTLIPLDPVLENITAAQLDTSDTQEQLESRAAGLNARAAALRRAGSAERNGNPGTEETE